VALKVRELLQPAAKERQGERNDLKPKSQDITADLRSSSPVAEAAAQQAAASVLAEQRRQDRNVAAQAAKAVGASPRAVEQAARVAPGGAAAPGGRYHPSRRCELALLQRR
jgi:hypothetical protein